MQLGSQHADKYLTLVALMLFSHNARLTSNIPLVIQSGTYMKLLD